MSTCAVCNEPTKNKCSNCNQCFYCCEDHQKKHWKLHKLDCHPFKVEQSDQLGRYLVTTRSIKPFEIILKESPLVCVPSQVTGPVCLGCLNAIEPSDYIECDKCGWPLCGIECKGKAVHQAECEFTINRGSKVSVKEFTNPHPLYQCMGTVRCLLLAKNDPEKWKRFTDLESLENLRRGSMQWKADLESIGKFIPRFFKSIDFDEDLIMKTIGILQINGHEVPVTDPPHVAIFNKASFLEHSCTPNLAKSFTREGNLILWAPKPIKKNTHLSICYSDAVWGTAERQQHLMHTKLFKCSCNRCLDVTEFGTNYDAFKCTEGSCEGPILPTSLKEWNSNWSCSKCGNQADISFIKNVLERAGKDLQAMDGIFFKSIDFDEDLIMKTIGILQINGHEVPVTDPPHVAIFNKASFLEHSCTPNLAKSFTREGNLILWAPKPIKKNTHLSICYSDAVWGTAERQQHLMHTKLFKCSCNRCLDVTEFGTNYDAFKCTEGSCEGPILPTSLKEWNSNWSCSKCGNQADISFIKNVLERAGKDLQAMDKTVDNCLKYINHYQKWLTNRHYFICQAKIQLVQLIGTDPKELMVVSEDKLNLKMEYVKELIELYENLAPCEVRMLGTFCFELHSAIAEHTRRVSLQTTLSPKNMLEESLLYVEKCINYLQYECDLFVEGHILKQAKINRDALRMVLVM